MKYIVSIICCVGLWTVALAQEEWNTTISGTVLNEQEQPVEFANIILKRTGQDSLLVKGVITDEQGRFAIEEIEAGNYYLHISQVGLGQLKTEAFTVNANNPTVQLGNIILKQEATTLTEVTVRSQKPFIERQLDKLVVNVENSIVSAGASAMEVLERSPGVIVDQNDAISLKGKQGVIVMIDGKPAQLGGTELANFLRGTPSAAIDKIEIIANPSAKYDAAGNAGIINIRMKRDQKLGFNGSFNLTYGNNRFNRYNAGTSMNYRNKKWNFFGSYNYANTRGFNNLILFRKFSEDGETEAIFDQNNYLIFPFSNNNARVGADFFATKKTTIGVLFSGISNRFNPTGDNVTYILDGAGQRTGRFTTQNRSQDHWYNYATNVNIRQTFNKPGKELSADFDYARYGNDTYQQFTTELFDAEDVLLNRDILIGDLFGYLNIYSGKADYVHPLTEKSKFELGWKSSLVKTDNTLNFYNRINAEDIFDASRSNHFIYEENINAGYLNFRQEFDKWSLQLGLRGEQTIADGLQVTTDSSFNRNYFQFFPSVFVQRNLSESHTMNISMSRRIDRPSYRQLNPFRAFVDRTTYQEGNPFLLPELTYSFELAHTYKEWLTTTLSYSVTDDNITSVLLQDDANRITVQTDLNIAEVKYYGLNVSATFNPVKWWNTRTEINGYYQRFTGNIRNTNLDNSRPTFALSSNNRFTLPKSAAGEINFFYQHTGAYGISIIEPIWQLSLGVQKSILKEKGTIRLNVNDIFWRGYPRGSTQFANIDETFSSRRGTRLASIAFSYRFGKNTVAPSRRRATGAEEEQRRASGGGNS
ncbi:MAG: outer membrane beta-barrel protein [Saprospiraceae bacterium]